MGSKSKRGHEHLKVKIEHVSTPDGQRRLTREYELILKAVRVMGQYPDLEELCEDLGTESGPSEQE